MNYGKGRPRAAVAALVWQLAAAILLIGAVLWPVGPERTAEAGPRFAAGECAPPQPRAIAPVFSAVPMRHGFAPLPPPVSARTAVVIDAETGQVLLGIGEHDRRPPASTTKIMTAILALEHADLDAWTIAQSDGAAMARRGSSVMGLRPGVPISVRDLLYGLMLPSGNDAALELALFVDGDVTRFVERMNAKAAELGLQNTHFSNPHGLDRRDHYSSAYDLAVLTRYAMANEQFRAIVATQWHDLQPPADYGFSNGNSLLASYPGAEGVKIGWTNRAGWTFVASAVRDGRRVIVTVLQSEDRDADAAALFDWAYAAHTWSPPPPAPPPPPTVKQLLKAFGVKGRAARLIRACG